MPFSSVRLTIYWLLLLLLRSRLSGTRTVIQPVTLSTEKYVEATELMLDKLYLTTL